MVVLRAEFLALLAVAVQSVSAQGAAWAQCGGVGWTGATTCVSGYTCVYSNAYYSQCLPGTASTTAATTLVTQTTATSSSAAATSTGTLDAKMKSNGREYFGTCADRNTLSDASYEAIVIAEYGQVTPENSMKWDATEKSRGVFSMSDADYLVDWATSHGKLIRGHTLVWHSQLPSWVSAITDAATLTTVIQDHITGVAGRYAGKIHHWDVVNEVFNDDGTFRTSVFYNVLGESFIDIAFRAAKAADPTAKLYINDYNLDYAGAKVNAMVTLVTRLIAAGVPIDGIGSQAHLILNNGAIPYMHQPLATLAATGLDVALTELDIRMTLPSDATKLADQKSNYQTAVYACKRTASCVGVTTWGVSDKYSWVPNTFSGSGAALIWDENFAKKPAYDGAADRKSVV